VPFAAEAALLGLSSGPACLASCGPVVVPWLAAEGRGYGGTARRLAVFLSGRLAGYLVFAVLAWALGLALPMEPRPRVLVFGAVHLALAGTLAWFALVRRKSRLPLVSLEAKPRAPRSTPAVLGLLTGLNLCPPFLAAAVRAAQCASLPAALGFFFLFFLGTLVWFPPLIFLGALRRAAVVATVARITVLLLAAYYAYLGVLSLGGFLLHA
jgi:sulfite exporter TauE/SafE